MIIWGTLHEGRSVSSQFLPALLRAIPASFLTNWVWHPPQKKSSSRSDFPGSRLHWTAQNNRKVLLRAPSSGEEAEKECSPETCLLFRRRCHRRWGAPRVSFSISHSSSLSYTRSFKKKKKKVTRYLSSFPRPLPEFNNTRDKRGPLPKWC